MSEKQITKETIDAIPFSGSVAVGTSQVQLSTNTRPAKKGLEIKAALTNTGKIYVGTNGVTANSASATDGYELGAGERVFIQPDDLTGIYLISDTASQKVFFIAQ